MFAGQTSPEFTQLALVSSMPTTTDRLEAIKRFRVEATQEGTRLVTGNDRRIEFPLRLTGVRLHASGPTSYAGRSISPEPMGNTRWLIMDHPTISIGAEGDEGFHSPLADDSLFVVDGSRLEHLPLRAIRIVALHELSQLDEEPASTAQETEGDKKWFGRACLSHVPAAPKLWGESVELTVGIPEPHFTDLFDSCVARRVDRVFIDALFRAHATGAFFESPRDLILFAKESTTGFVTYVGVGSTLTSHGFRDAVTPDRPDLHNMADGQT